MPFTSTPITVKDSASADKSIIAFNDGTSTAFAHPLLDSAGAIISPATATNQTSTNTKLDTVIARTPVLGSAVSANATPVVIASDQGALPLPTGAATSANQTTSNSSLATIVTNTTSIATAGNQSSTNTKLDTLIAVQYPRVSATASFTRPADVTAYAFGELVANSTTAGSVVPLTIIAARANDISGQVIRGVLLKSGAVLTGALFRVHLFNVSPTVTNGDNAVFMPANLTNWLGALDVTIATAATSGSGGVALPVLGSSIPFVPAAGTQNLFALIEARAAYTPANGEIFTLELEVL